jgi:hypothetical protein
MPWMKPPSIWPRSMAGFSERPTSCRMSTRTDPVLAGQGVDHHLRTGRAIGEVVERPAVVARGRSGCSASGSSRRRQRDPRDVGELTNSRRLISRSPSRTPSGVNTGSHAELVAGERRQPRLDLPAGVQRRHAVEVAARRGGGGRGVGHLVGARRADLHRVERDLERLGDHLGDLDVEALAHLGAAVVQVDRAVGVDVHQGAGLVQVAGGEGDAELHRRQRDAALIRGFRRWPPAMAARRAR